MLQKSCICNGVYSQKKARLSFMEILWKWSCSPCLPIVCMHSFKCCVPWPERSLAQQNIWMLCRNCYFNMSFHVKILPLKRKGANLVPFRTSALVRLCSQGKLWILAFEWFGLEETLKIILFQTPAMGKDTLHLDHVAQSSSSCNVVDQLPWATCCSAFITLRLKNFFQISSLNL